MGNTRETEAVQAVQVTEAKGEKQIAEAIQAVQAARVIQAPGNPGFPVFIGPGTLNRCGAFLADRLPTRQAAVIADEAVAWKYGFPMMESLRVRGFTVCGCLVSPGRDGGREAAVREALAFLTGEGIAGADVLLALGGGFTQAAADVVVSCRRELRLVRMPTTLWSMAHSAAVENGNTSAAENDNVSAVEYGDASAVPVAVFCDTDCLHTLPSEQFAAGVTELVQSEEIRLSEELPFSLPQGETLSADSSELPDLLAAYVARLVRP